MGPRTRLIAAVGVVFSSCATTKGSEAAPALAADLAKTRIAVRATTDVVIDRSNGLQYSATNLGASLAALLRDAGYAVVSDKDAEPELVLNVRLDSKEEDTPFRYLNISVNGRSPSPTRTLVNMTVVAMRPGDSALIDQATLSFTQREEAPAAGDLAPIERDFRANGKLRAYAAALQEERRASAERAAREAREESERARLEEQRRQEMARRDEQQRVATRNKDDDDAWTTASKPDAMTSCRTPKRSQDCAEIRAYLVRFGEQGRHGADARAILTETEPLLARLADDEHWAAADVAKCQKPTTSADCALVDAYLKDRPQGAHVDEATKLLGKSRPKLAALLKSEEAKARKEEEARQREEAEAPRRALRERFQEAKNALVSAGCKKFVTPAESGFRNVRDILSKRIRLDAKFRDECPEQECQPRSKLQKYSVAFDQLAGAQRSAMQVLEQVGIGAVYAGCGEEFNEFYVVGLECFDPDEDGGPSACK